MMFVTFLRRAPFLRPVLALYAGIFIQLYIPLKPWALLTAVEFPVILLLVFKWLPFRIRYQYDWLRGMVLQLLLLCSGCILAELSDVRNSANYYRPMLLRGDLLEGTINEPLQARQRSYKTIMEVDAIIREGRRMHTHGKLLVYLTKDSLVRRLQEGDRLLLISADISDVRRNSNPGMFDYRQYCALRQIYAETFLQPGSWKQLRGKGYGHLMQWVTQCRDYCVRTLHQYVGGREAGLAAALLIGYRYDLDREMVQQYTNTGVVHIIAISGMHLALIYGFLLWITSWWPVNRSASIVKGAVIVLLLWGFTLLTGASASVLRATVMFSFLTIGKFMLDRYTNVYNTLAASAFLLLCYDPRLLTDVGFQLSYLAVLSLIVFYRRLYLLMNISRRWLDSLWRITAVTLAAQVLTLPVCLYYFHQFPVWFLPANMLAVPLSTVILYGEVCLVLTAKTFVAAGIGKILSLLITGLNIVIAWFSNSGVLITDVQLHLPGMICLYGCIAGMTICWLLKRRQAFIFAVCCTTCWSVCDLFVYIIEQHQQKMVVYNIPGQTTVDVMRGKKAVCLLQMPADSIYHKYIHPAHALYGVRYDVKGILSESRISTDISAAIGQVAADGACTVRGCRMVCIGQKRLVIVDSALAHIHPRKKIRTDYLLLSHNPQVDIRQLEQMFDVGCYIFDASSGLRRIQQWKSDCYVLTLRFFSVPDQGAYVVNF